MLCNEPLEVLAVSKESSMAQQPVHDDTDTQCRRRDQRRQAADAVGIGQHPDHCDCAKSDGQGDGDGEHDGGGERGTDRRRQQNKLGVGLCAIALLRYCGAEDFDVGLLSHGREPARPTSFRSSAARLGAHPQNYRQRGHFTIHSLLLCSLYLSICSRANAHDYQHLCCCHQQKNCRTKKTFTLLLDVLRLHSPRCRGAAGGHGVICAA